MAQDTLIDEFRKKIRNKGDSRQGDTNESFAAEMRKLFAPIFEAVEGMDSACTEEGTGVSLRFDTEKIDLISGTWFLDVIVQKDDGAYKKFQTEMRRNTLRITSDGTSIGFPDEKWNADEVNKAEAALINHVGNYIRDHFI